MTFVRLMKWFLWIGCLLIVHVCLAQGGPGYQSWTARSEQRSPGGTLNPIRTNETHVESDSLVVDMVSVETIGLDGRYVPYSDTEKESRRINETTVRTVERTFGRDSDHHRVLIQERQEESRDLPGGEQRVTRIISNPDANGRLQVVQRELEDSKQINGVRVSATTVITPDGNGGLSAALKIEQRDTKSSDGSITSKKATRLSDGTGGWKLAEIRETTTQSGDLVGNKDERVLQPDSSGELKVVEHRINKQVQTDGREMRELSETYATNVPGVAGDRSLRLVRRQTTVRGTTSGGTQRTVLQIKQPYPGELSNDLHITQETVNIVRLGAGVVDQSHIILTPGSDGRLDQVWIDTRKTDNASVMKVDTSTTTNDH